MKHCIIIIIIASQLLPNAYPMDTGGPREENSRENLISFTRSLVRSGEYYRALHELDRLAAFHGGTLDPLVYSVTKNYLLFQGGRSDSLLAGTILGVSPLERITGSIFRTDAAFGLKDYHRAGDFLKSHEKGRDPAADEMMDRRRFFSFVMHDRLETRGGRPLDADFSKYRELMESARFELGTLKSPGIAALLGVIPGMGHVYTGNTGTGIVALIMVSVNAAVSYYGFRAGNMPLGIFVGAIGTFFYGGSILGGYLSAGAYNKTTLDSLGNRLESRLKFSEDHEYLYRKYGLGKYDAE